MLIANFVSSGEVDEIGIDEGEIILSTLDGDFVRFRVSDFRISKRQPPVVDDATFFSKPEWTPEEIRERGLPPEWSRDWLIEQLYQFRSVGEVSRKSLRPEESIQRFSNIHSIFRDYDGEMVRMLWRSGRFKTQLEIAKHLFKTDQWVSRHLRQIRSTTANDELRQIIAEVQEKAPHASARTQNAEIIRIAKERGDTRREEKISYTITQLRRQ